MMRLIRQTSLLILGMLAACGRDAPTGIMTPAPTPQANAVLVSSRINLLKGPNFETYTDFSLPAQPAPTSTTPAQWCDNARKLQTAWWSDQKQRLVWDDYSILQTNPLRTMNGVVVSGRLRIKFRGYIGVYSGQPIQCLRIDGLYYDRMRNYPTVMFQPLDPPTTFAIDAVNNWAFCFGTIGCQMTPARIHVQVQAIWNRRCHMDIYVTNCSQSIQNGQLAWELPDDGYLSSGQWDVMVQADGWWSAYNYGGNPDYVNGVQGAPKKTGFWVGGRSGYYLLGSYGLSTTTGYAANQEGTTHWECCAAYQ